MLITALLLQKSFIKGFKLNFSPSRIFFNHEISPTPLAIALNYASAVLRATTFCFLLLHVTRLA